MAKQSRGARKAWTAARDKKVATTREEEGTKGLPFHVSLETLF